MSNDESGVRDLLRAAQQQPGLLDPREVLVQGRRREWRKRLAPVVALLLVAALAGGLAVAQSQSQHGPFNVSSVVSADPGETIRLDVSDVTFGVAVRPQDGKTGPFLVVHLPDGNGGWREVSGGGVIDTPPTDHPLR